MKEEKRFFRNAAFVLGNTSFGEADRALVLLSEDIGKMQVAIQGIRKSKKRDKVATEALSLTEFHFYKKGNRYIVSDFASIENFMNIRTDLDRLGMALYFLEVVNKFVFEGYRAIKVYRLLKNCLYYLDKEENRKKQWLLVLFFLCRMLREEGILEEKSLAARFDEKEKEIFALLLENKVKEIEKEESYEEKGMIAMIQKMEIYVEEHLDTKISVEKYMMGGVLC